MTQEERKLYDAANAYAFDLDCGDLNTNRDTFIAGAEWQYEQFEKNRLAACDNMTKEEFDREQEFTTDFIEKNHRIPTYSDAIEYGRESMREKLTKLEELANKMYYAAQYLTTDALKLRKAMRDYWHYVVYELKKE